MKGKMLIILICILVFGFDYKVLLNSVDATNIFLQSPLWSYTTGGSVRSVSISGDGEWMAAGSDDNYVYLLWKNSGIPLWSYKTGDWVFSVSISNDGNYVATGSGAADKNIYFFEWSSSTPLWNYTTEGTVLSISLSINGSYLAAVSYNKLYLFKQSGPPPEWTYVASDYLAFASISNDSSYIVSGGWDNQVHLFNRSSDSPLWSYMTGGVVWSGSISADNNFVAAGSGDNNVYLFNRTNPNPLWKYLTGDDILSVSFSANGNYLAAGSNDWNAYLFGPDIIPPDPVVLSSPTSGTVTNNTTPTFSWNLGTDPSPPSGIATYYLEITSSSNFTINRKSVLVGNKTNYTMTTPLSDGTGYWHVRTMDNAGNNGSWSLTWSFLIDTMPPSDLSITINNDVVFTNSTSVILTVYAYEADKMSFSSDNSTWSDWEMYSTAKSWILIIGDGIKYVYFKVKDKAGNVASSVYDTIILDTTPPTTVVLFSPINKSTIDDDTPTFSWLDSSDINGIVFYTLQIDTLASFHSPNLMTITDVMQTDYTLITHLPEGTWHWRVFAVDAAGNAGTSSKHVFIIQLMPPWLAWLHKWSPTLTVIGVSIGFTSLCIGIYKLKRGEKRKVP